IDLLRRRLADVTDPQVPGDAIEGEPPRVAKPVRPDLGPRLRRAREGVPRRDRVRSGPARGRTDPQDLAGQRVQRLRVSGGIPAAVSVAVADVQVTVRSEHEVAAVVVVEALMDRQEQTASPEQGTAVLEAVADDPRLAPPV